MKSSLEKTTKSNQRSQALKGIFEKQEIEYIPKDPIKGVIEIANPTSSSRMATFGAEVINPLASSAASITQSTTQSIALFNGLIDKELARAAAGLGIEEEELKAWVDLQIDVPAKTILTLLRSMQSLHLDPLCEEISFTQYNDGQWQVFITIEGCSKLLNQHPQFNGLVFNQADTLIDGVPEWIECTIHRKDRTLPTTVREYLTEVRGENPIWQKMLRIMALLIML